MLFLHKFVIANKRCHFTKTIKKTGLSFHLPCTYVNNLNATLQSVYSFCGITIPDRVVSEATRLQNTTHDCTERRASYDPNFNRSLTSLGVDEEKVKEHLTEYFEWIDQLENCKKYN